MSVFSRRVEVWGNGSAVVGEFEKLGFDMGSWLLCMGGPTMEGRCPVASELSGGGVGIGHKVALFKIGGFVE